jgi:hypothetical protein
MTPELLLAALGLVVAVLLWLFKPDWLRRLLRLQEADEPAPYRLPGTQITLLRADPVIGAAVAEVEAKGLQLSFVHRHELGAYLQKGYVQFRTSRGAACEFKTPSETLALLVKKGAA